jgi:hypothetical protein
MCECVKIGFTFEVKFSGILWGGGGGFDKAEPNSQFHGKYIRNNLIRIRV